MPPTRRQSTETRGQGLTQDIFARILSTSPARAFSLPNLNENLWYALAKTNKNPLKIRNKHAIFQP